MATTSISPLRLTGMASGMDTDGIIKSLMQIEQLKMDREVRALQTLQWKQAAQSSVKSDLTTFRQTYASILSPQNLLSESAYNTVTAKVTGGDTAAVTVTGSVHATPGSITLDIVKLAKGATATSTGISQTGTRYQSTATKLGDLSLEEGNLFNGGDTISFALTNGAASETFTFGKDETLAGMMAKINASDVGVTMSYSQLTDGFTIATKQTGAAAQLAIENITGNAFGSGGAFGIDTANLSSPYEGQDAMAWINSTEFTSDKNTFSLDGITYTLNKETTGTLDITVARDVTAAVDRIKGFVEGYNAMVAKLTKLVTDSKTTDEKKYIALTAEEKEAMTETEIAVWEDIAKKGLLRRDSGIESLLRDLRSALYETIEGAGVSPSSIGLKTARYDSGLGGQITLDEDVLKSALESDPERVMGIFTQSPTSTDPTAARRESGLITRITAAFDKYTKGSQTVTTDGLASSIQYATERITKQEERMKAQEEKLYLKYAAMETALSQLNSQSEWLAGIIASGAQ